MTTITEADVEQVALEWLVGLGWGVAHGLDIAPGTPDAEWSDFGDVVLFVNGLPLGIIELKSPTDEDATLNSAWRQLQTYKSELSTLFSMNEALVVSDSNEARIGTLTAGWEWFKPWANRHWGEAGRGESAGASGDVGGGVSAVAIPVVGARLHRVRGQRRRGVGEEDGGLPPVSLRAGDGG